MEDLFGLEARKEFCLVDAASRDEFDEFDAMLESLYPVWTRCELEARKLTIEDNTLFYSYFLHYVTKDMKGTMIASVRKEDQV